MLLSSHSVRLSLIISLSHIRNNQILMTSNLTPAVSYQRDQIIPVGCCFRSIIENPIKGVKQMSKRIHSEPKSPKHKMIEVTISRKGSSQTKETRNTPVKSKREKHVPHALSGKKISENWKAFSSVASKLTQQKSSSKQLKVTFNQMDGNDADVNFKKFQNPLPAKTANKKDQISMLSQISLVQQSFISPHSMTNPLYAFIWNHNLGQHDYIRESYRSLFSNEDSFGLRRQISKPPQKWIQGTIPKQYRKLYIQ